MKILAQRKQGILVEFPPRRQSLYIEGEYFNLPFPWTYYGISWYAATNRNLVASWWSCIDSFYASKSQASLDQESLFVLPFPNIYTDGHMCTPHVNLPSGITDFEKIVLHTITKHYASSFAELGWFSSSAIIHPLLRWSKDSYWLEPWRQWERLDLTDICSNTSFELAYARQTFRQLLSRYHREEETH